MKISSLLNQIQILQKEKEKEKENISLLSNKIEKNDISSESLKNENKNENVDNHDITAAAAAAVSNQKKIEKYEEDLKNIRLDVDRLQVEKKEAEVAGKSFLDRFVVISKK